MANEFRKDSVSDYIEECAAAFVAGTEFPDPPAMCNRLYRSDTAPYTFCARVRHLDDWYVIAGRSSLSDQLLICDISKCDKGTFQGFYAIPALCRFVREAAQNAGVPFTFINNPGKTGIEMAFFDAVLSGTAL